MKIGIGFKDDIGKYNRKTTDYGNGKIEITAYHRPQLRYTGKRPPASERKPVLSDEAQKERTKKQIYAIRRRIKGYAFANDFKWFVTLTFNPKKVDSHNYDTAKTALLKWCRLMRDKYKKFDYLIIPELHKSGAVHFHGLLGDVPADFAEAVSPKTGRPVIRRDRPVYNLIDWKYGFSDCEEIENPDRAASYITKYVTSALLTDKEMYNKKRYFNSQGLIRPSVSFDMTDNTELNDFTPNFGIVETDSNGRNFIDVGIYKLTVDEKTGGFIQEDTNCLTKAKKQTLI